MLLELPEPDTDADSDEQDETSNVDESEAVERQESELSPVKKKARYACTFRATLSGQKCPRGALHLHFVHCATVI